MPRTIEERLQEVLSAVGGEWPQACPESLDTIAQLLRTLLADFKAEGIAGRTIMDPARIQLDNC